jgi:DNA-binding transcriptional LysR family regulator
VQLVERLPRSCRLTLMGRQVFEQAQSMESSAFSVERLARAGQEPLVNDVRLSAPPVLVTHLLAGQMARFQARVPHVRLSVLSQVQQVSLSRREADVALRMARPKEPTSVARKVGCMPFALYAHRDYPELGRPGDWRFIGYDEEFADTPQQQWLMQVAAGRGLGCALSEISAQAQAARGGAGVAGLPCFIGDADPALVRLASPARPFSADLWLLVHRDLRRSAPVRAVTGFVAELIAGQAGLGLPG